MTTTWGIDTTAGDRWAEISIVTQTGRVGVQRRTADYGPTQYIVVLGRPDLGVGPVSLPIGDETALRRVRAVVSMAVVGDIPTDRMIDYRRVRHQTTYSYRPADDLTTPALHIMHDPAREGLAQWEVWVGADNPADDVSLVLTGSEVERVVALLTLALAV